MRQKKKLWAHHSHKPTPEQGNGWVFIDEVEELRPIAEFLSNTPREPEALLDVARRFLSICERKGFDIYQPGGSPAFLFALGTVAPSFDVSIFFAHTERRTIETSLPDGSVELRHTFKFEGWTPFPSTKKEAI